MLVVYVAYFDHEVECDMDPPKTRLALTGLHGLTYQKIEVLKHHSCDQFLLV
jgi:hypothetical protein